MKGWKVFEHDLTCRGYQYKVGKTFEQKESPIMCERGFHFCKNPLDLFKFYPFELDKVVCEVNATGEVIDADDGKSATNKITIVRKLELDEMLNTVNEGKNNFGWGNIGNNNKGNCNKGDGNKGNCNKGDYNEGNR